MLQEQEELLLGGPAGSGPGSMLSLNKLGAKTKKLRQARWTHGVLHPTLGALMLHVGAGGCACPLCQEMGEELSNAFPNACECVLECVGLGDRCCWSGEKCTPDEAAHSASNSSEDRPEMSCALHLHLRYVNCGTHNCVCSSAYIPPTAADCVRFTQVVRTSLKTRMRMPLHCPVRWQPQTIGALIVCSSEEAEEEQ